jgi:hypothetical protein
MNKSLLFKGLLVLIFGSFQLNSFATIDYVGNMWPASGSSSTTVQGEEFTIYIQAYKAGVTEPGGQGAGINCEIYYGDVNGFGMPWLNVFTQAMTYNLDVGNNDEYIGVISPLAALYEFTCRCSDDDGATWTWASQPSGNGLLTVDALLPTELVSFKASSLSNSVNLNWVTASEADNSHFIIEKSTDFRFWEALTFVEGQGNSLVRNEYSAVDDNPVNGTNYYRLKQVDIDGSFTFSDIVSIHFDKKEKIKVYPNPAREVVYFRLENEMTGILGIYNLQGQLVMSRMLVDEVSFEMNLNNLANGVYFYRISDVNGILVDTQKLYIQK